MKAAFIKILRGTVENVIVADATKDYAPNEYVLVNVPDDMPVDANYQWDSVEGLKPPRKVVGVKNNEVVAVEVVKYFDSDPEIPDVDEVIIVDHATLVEVGYVRNQDGSLEPKDVVLPVEGETIEGGAIEK